MARSRANPWVSEQNRLWSELAGSTIVGWSGLDESAGTDDELIFLDRGAPFQQLRALRLEREGAVALELSTYQDADAFGLALKPSSGAPHPVTKWSRVSDLSYLPTGPVERLEVRLDSRADSRPTPIEAHLTIGGTPVLIVAAEVYPTWNEPAYMWGDECFFVFADPTLADSVTWGCERVYSPRIIPDDGVDVFDMRAS